MNTAGAAAGMSSLQIDRCTGKVVEDGTILVAPAGWENLLRLAEDLATVDLLSGGRLNPGISVGPPMRWDDVKGALYPDTADRED